MPHSLSTAPLLAAAASARVPTRLARRVAPRALLVALGAALVLGCAGLGGGGGRAQTHVVQRGDTVWSIAQRYGTTVDQVVRLNALRDPGRIAVGQRLRVPGGGASFASRSSAARSPRVTPSRTGPWLWPVEGPLSSSYGPRGRRRHDGIDIVARSGTPILAAKPGRVVYSGSGVPGYGNLIILKHEGSLSTVYAHCRRNLVRVGQRVARGAVIGEVGQTGRATGPHLHFEVRVEGRPQNPLQFLP